MSVNTLLKSRKKIMRESTAKCLSFTTVVAAVRTIEMYKRDRAILPACKIFIW